MRSCCRNLRQLPLLLFRSHRPGRLLLPFIRGFDNDDHSFKLRSHFGCDNDAHRVNHVNGYSVNLVSTSLEDAVASVQSDVTDIIIVDRLIDIDVIAVTAVKGMTSTMTYLFSCT